MLKTRKRLNYYRIIGIMVGLAFLFLSVKYNYWFFIREYTRNGVAPNSIFRVTYPIVNIAVFIISMIILWVVLFRFDIFIRYKKEILLLISVSLICFISLEMLLILAYKIAPSHTREIFGDFYVDTDDFLYSPHPYLSYYPRPNYVSSDNLNIHDSYGFRGQQKSLNKSPNIFRIVTLGGSTTYTIKVEDYKKSYPYLLEKFLREDYNLTNVEVINAGCGGYSSFETYANLYYRVLDFKPDLIIIYQAMNDVHARFVPPDKYRSDNIGKRKTWEKPKVPFFMNSLLLRILLHYQPYSLDSYVETDTTITLGFFTYGDIYMEKIGGSPSEILEENKPIYFRKNIENIIMLARSNNISVLLTSFAYIPLDNYITKEEYMQNAINEHNQITKDLANEYNTYYYDFASEMSTDKKYWNGGVHVNEWGSYLKAKLFARYIYNNIFNSSNGEA